jgi:hypothetical protein
MKGGVESNLQMKKYMYNTYFGVADFYLFLSFSFFILLFMLSLDLDVPLDIILEA